jgi:hypothetical protein
MAARPPGAARLIGVGDNRSQVYDKGGASEAKCRAKNDEQPAAYPRDDGNRGDLIHRRIQKTAANEREVNRRLFLLLRFASR